MASQIQGKALLLANYGQLITRAAAALPQTATAAIFNVTGGQVIVTSLFGVVTTAVQAQATTIQLNVLNTAIGGGGTIISSAAGDLNAAPVGTIIGTPLSGLAAGNPLTVTAYGSQNNEFTIGTGSIRLVTGASSTGAVKWYLNFIPLDPGAFVTAA